MSIAAPVLDRSQRRHRARGRAAHQPAADQTIPAREITTRRVSFRYPEEGLPQHFVNGDLVMSHVTAMLSAMFPNGEDFFVRSVRNYRDRITDPELKKQVAKFIGQEAIHGREHREFNDRLARMGFATRYVDKAVDVGLNRIGARFLPESVQLAVTAALEHYTATLAEVLMSDDQLREDLSGEVRNLFLWHALEESEHKSVAFDVYQSMVGNHWLRVGVMKATTALFLFAIADSTVRSLRRDPAARDWKRLRASLAEMRHSPLLSKKVRERIGDYDRRDFHPDDHDTVALLEYWREQLFGAEGELNDRLPARAAS